MSMTSPGVRPGWLRRTSTFGGTVELEGPEPGPAGEAAVEVAPGVLVGFDAADPRIVTRVQVEDPDVHLVDVANLLGSAGADLVTAEPGATAFTADERTKPVRWAVARLALLLLNRTIPGPFAGSPSWSYEALVLGESVAGFGFDVHELLAAEATGAGAALIDELSRTGPPPEPEELAVRAAHVAVRVMDPLHPLWYRLSEIVADLPDVLDGVPRFTWSDDLVRSVPRWLGEERAVVRTYPLLWSWLPVDLLPSGDAFATAISASFEEGGARIRVTCNLRPRLERAVFARVVERSTRKVLSVFALRFDGGTWLGDDALPADTLSGDVRVEVVSTVGAAVLDEDPLRVRVGTQWGRLACQAERRGALRVAAAHWLRAAEQFAAAGEGGLATTANRYADECLGGADDPDLRERRELPFESELGPEPPEERG